MRYLLDTTALLAHYRQEPGWATVQALFENPEAEIDMASVSLAEYARRLHDLGATDAEVAEALATYSLLLSEVVAIDKELAQLAYAIYRQTPQRLPLIDALIAAAAQSRQATLIHRDRHMAAVPDTVLAQQLLADDLTDSA